MKPFNIVEATTDDDFLAAGSLGVRLVHSHYVLNPSRFTHYDGTDRDYAESLKQSVESVATSIVLLAREGAKQHTLGYVFGQVQHPDVGEAPGAFAHLHELYVTEDARHRGVGKALIMSFVGRAKACGSDRLVVMVASVNRSAQELFAYAGFVPTMVEMTCQFG